MAAKKTKKTKTGKAKSKKKKTAATTTEAHVVRISCDGGCTADPEDLHVHFGDVVVFVAEGTDAEIEFPPGKSPFGRRKFIIQDGGFDADQIDKKMGTFDYSHDCEECPAPALPPRIIID